MTKYIIPAGTDFYYDYSIPDTLITYDCDVKINVVGTHTSPDMQEIWGVTELLEKPVGQKCSSQDYFKHDSFFCTIKKKWNYYTKTS